MRTLGRTTRNVLAAGALLAYPAALAAEDASACATEATIEATTATTAETAIATAPAPAPPPLQGITGDALDRAVAEHVRGARMVDAEQQVELSARRLSAEVDRHLRRARATGLDAEHVSPGGVAVVARVRPSDDTGWKDLSIGGIPTSAVGQLLSGDVPRDALVARPAPAIRMPQVLSSAGSAKPTPDPGEAR